MKGQQRLLYLLPACILVFAFFLFPLAYLSYISFFEWDGLGPKTFVGFENFEYVFSENSSCSSHNVYLHRLHRGYLPCLIVKFWTTWLRCAESVP